MILPVCPRSLQKGEPIQTPWSTHVVVKEILVTTQVGNLTFYGVRAETQDSYPWDWLSTESLLWVFDDGTGPRMWQHPAQPVPYSFQEPENNLERIVGHYESRSGECYVAVKWKNCLSPTWELEENMGCLADALTCYFNNISDQSWAE
ncbi:uncharacterized protein NECHADRAFT_55184 [Fusarium vanettenii 77-13-4]|uniref:Chromo domain-containing protein n=1 Tax=Fusarium vanettenii (strain ATCC MYA-4622 / CBS 123669 / FGSC 9596 / NRRL 45880 / 77-13-4) TaxID=660122 RepID=C7ZBI9_FUSV7|nr:uncharacterized protein NECHADRAFT_55184 [Fusarium vanettenii 77-13-4]EEU38576.1 hypothetical protein NECHADRAFT_55184 [Fusarium vanettenii 77-13-4]